MSNITKIIGQRIRSYRTAKHLSQEKLSELAGCHPTYIGQIERAEKNVSLESIEKIATALNIPLSKLFEKLGGEETATRSIPLECYELIVAKSKAEQEQILRILIEIDKYKNKQRNIAINIPRKTGISVSGIAPILLAAHKCASN